MPTYDYECLSCRHLFEAFQSIKAEALKKCPKCGKKVQRLIGGGGALLLKGSGFYQTDYRSTSYKEGQKKEGSSQKDSCATTGCKQPVVCSPKK